MNRRSDGGSSPIPARIRSKAARRARSGPAWRRFSMPTELHSKGRLAGKKVLLTAAAQGIGRASAAAMAREGAHVIATDLRDDKLRDLDVAETRQLDVTDRDAVIQLA